MICVGFHPLFDANCFNNFHQQFKNTIELPQKRVHETRYKNNFITSSQKAFPKNKLQATTSGIETSKKNVDKPK